MKNSGGGTPPNNLPYSSSQVKVALVFATVLCLILWGIAIASLIGGGNEGAFLPITPVMATVAVVMGMFRLRKVRAQEPDRQG
jgi:hypothetical protein